MAVAGVVTEVAVAVAKALGMAATTGVVKVAARAEATWWRWGRRGRRRRWWGGWR